MFYTALTILALLPPCLGIVDCRIACRRCRERVEEPGILEVYCAMCRECRDRQREGARSGGYLDHEQSIYNQADYPDDCPTPPPCDSDTEMYAQTLKHRVYSTTTTTSSTTTTTTRRPCPPIPPCKKRTTMAPCAIPCVPMYPMCPCPYPYPPYTPSPGPPVHQKLVDTHTSTAAQTGFMYLYVGVPKDALDKTHR